jgi:thiol-disulfide isomerase/thioredoxin
VKAPALDLPTAPFSGIAIGMRLRFLPGLALMLLMFSSSAAPIKLSQLKIGSKTYTNIVVLGANATDLYFTYNEGIKSVKLRYLDPQMQKRFHFDPEAAADAEKRQLEEDAAYQNSIAATIAAKAQTIARSNHQASVTSEDSIADPVVDNSLLGKKGPKLVVEKWLGDTPDVKGKFVLIHFWAPWSIPARKSILEMNALNKKFSEKLVVVGLAGESEADVAALSEPKMEYPSAIDTKGRVSAAVGVTSVPSALLLNPKGMVVFVGHPSALTEKRMQALLDKWVE